MWFIVSYKLLSQLTVELTVHHTAGIMFLKNPITMFQLGSLIPDTSKKLAYSMRQQSWLQKKY